MFLQQTATHIVALRRIRVRKVHVKAALAYSGAFLMGADAGVAVVLVLAPHAPIAVALHAYEQVTAVGGKCGAAAAGCTVFFDRLLAGLATESV